MTSAPNGPMRTGSSRTDPGRLDYSTMEELGEREGDVGLTSAAGRNLNGRLGTVRGVGGTNDGTANPYLAQMPDGRYRVEVEFDETANEEVSPGRYRHRPKTKTYSLKRGNLEMVDVGIGTLARNREGAAALRARGVDTRTTAEREAAEPGIAGWFPAILQGDAVRTREILEYVRAAHGEDFADGGVGDWSLDATGDTALLGGIQHGHLEIVKVLVEFGANVNRMVGIPMLRDCRLSYLNMAIMSVDDNPEGEAIVDVLIDAGADVNSNGTKGTPLALATTIKSDHSKRMRLCRKLLAKGADPNQIINTCPPHLGGRSEALVLIGLASAPSGAYSEADRLELLDLLLEAGADPGILVTITAGGRNESCNAIQTVVSRRQTEVLRLLLSTDKGRAAVNVPRREGMPAPPGENNGDGETALTMAVGRELAFCRADRDIAVQLLKAGADPEVKDSMGISPAMWLDDPDTEHAELKRLIKKSQGLDPSFWDSEEVKHYIDSGRDTVHQCLQCLVWSDQMEGFEGEDSFSRCSKCKSAYYCSRKCQKIHWKQHKQSCQPP